MRSWSFVLRRSSGLPFTMTLSSCPPSIAYVPRAVYEDGSFRSGSLRIEIVSVQEDGLAGFLGFLCEATSDSIGSEAFGRSA
jgi:hypothetical protein